MRKIVVIIPNELETNIPLFTFSCEDNHREGIWEFLYQNDFPLPEEKRITSQEISFSLAEQGFCVLMGEEDETEKNLVAFLSTRISPNQYEYFERRKKGLENYNFAFFDRTDNSLWNIIDRTTFSGDIMEEFLKRLKNKVENISPKVKKRTDK